MSGIVLLSLNLIEWLGEAREEAQWVSGREDRGV
jgi:hypothetical protein